MKPESTTERYRFSERPLVSEVWVVLDALDGDLSVRELNIRAEYSPALPAPWASSPVAVTPDSYVLEITLEGEK